MIKGCLCITLQTKPPLCVLHVLSSTRVLSWMHACLRSTRGDVSSLLPLRSGMLLLDGWSGGMEQTHGRWRMASAKPWHRAIQPTEMIDVKSNFKHPQLKQAGQARPALTDARLQRSDNTRPHLNPTTTPETDSADKYCNNERKRTCLFWKWAERIDRRNERVFRREGCFRGHNVK